MSEPRCYTSGLLPQISRAGAWFLRSGIQEPNGGVARYHRLDTGCNLPVSTEITGYAVSTLVYLHSLTHDERYLDAAVAAARFLARAWDGAAQTMPFEIDPPCNTYFFDCGIIVRGLLAAWRATGEQEFVDVATAVGTAMERDFAAAAGGFHPVLALPGKTAADADPLRWSRSQGCYQLKSAMAWWDLAEATGDERFREPYERVLARSLQSHAAFLPGHPERPRVMDRLHAYLYFLEGLLPRANDPRCATALCTGIRAAAQYLREIAPEFERADVLAQLLRIRLYADWAGAAPVDRTAAEEEAERLAAFQIDGGSERTDGGFYFGRAGDAWLPYVNPVTTAFALQALELWHAGSEAQAHRHLLI